MHSDRRSFLQNIGGTGVGLAGLNLLSRDAKSVRLSKKATQAMLSNYPRETRSDSFIETYDRNPDRAYEAYCHGSELRILNTFRQEPYGWQVEVGLAGNASGRRRDENSGQWQDENQRLLGLTKVEAVNINPSGDYEPDFDNQFQGYYPKTGNIGNIQVPDWAEPAFDTTIGVLTGAAASTGTGVAATIGVGVDDIIGALSASSGEESFESDRYGLGFREKYQPTLGFPIGDFPTGETDMAHFQRITGRHGDYLGQMRIKSQFNQFPGSKYLKTEYDVSIISDDRGEIQSVDGNRSENRLINNVRPQNWPNEMREKYGYVEFDKDEPKNLSQTNPQVRKYKKRLNRKIEGEEITAVMLNPPLEIK